MLSIEEGLLKAAAKRKGLRTAGKEEEGILNRYCDVSSRANKEATKKNKNPCSFIFSPLPAYPFPHSLVLLKYRRLFRSNTFHLGEWQISAKAALILCFLLSE